MGSRRDDNSIRLPAHVCHLRHGRYPGSLAGLHPLEERTWDRVNSRERVLLALAHQEPDRVPIDYWATPEITTRLVERFGFSAQEELLDHLGVDLTYIKGPEYIGPDPIQYAERYHFTGDGQGIRILGS